ncbi:MAG: NADH:ubiquinone reductase (Na(+)-transporting) subunit D [Desulfobacteraceae bacterium]|nr:NADH:ubiquinone reductase (Na(+)-transporting) subunit D [Desulfobacteraceae bacterium]
MKLLKNKYFKTMLEPVIGNNPINVQMLGICSALAVTVQLKTALVMGLALTFVVTFSNFIVSVFRKFVPENIRIIFELCVIASLVILADEFLKAYLFGISKQLSVFVGLIITNCLVMGRAETFALGSTPGLSIMDGLGNGLGYSLVLIFVALVRELFGSGSIFGYKIIPEFLYKAGYTDMGFMLLAPAAFIIIGLLVWLQNSLFNSK